MLAEPMVVQARRVSAEPMVVRTRREICREVERTRRVLPEPIVLRVRHDFVERARCVFAMCYGPTALGVCLSCYK